MDCWLAGLLIAGRQKGKKASKGKKTGRMRDKKDWSIFRPSYRIFFGGRVCLQEAVKKKRSDCRIADHSVSKINLLVTSFSIHEKILKL